MKTYQPKSSEIARSWFLVDASGQTLGRLASCVAYILRGKHKPIYSTYIDTGDHVIVINAEKVKLTGKKLQQKFYYYHSGYPGGLKQINYKDLLSKNPEKAIRLAVKRMLPHNKLGKDMLKKLRVYRGSQHPHQAQNPQIWQISYKKFIKIKGA